MLKRKAYEKMLIWKNTPNKKTALLLDGARRVGKSWLCYEFAKNEYKSNIIIDFGNVAPSVIEIFEQDSHNLDLFFMKISAFYQVPLFERESVIVFDEVQRFPQARQLIKYLIEDGRYDYIETGSLLSLKRNVEDIILPSEEKHLNIFPLDFEEFLWALGDTTTMPLIKHCFEEKKPLGKMLHRKILNDFRQYILVGGMPQAVNMFIENKDFSAVDDVKRGILTLYRNDVSKFARGYENKVIGIFDQIPGQLAKKDKKYRLSSISKKARMREYDDAFLWLDDAMITNTCFNATDPIVGLNFSTDYSTRKCYMADTGLLITQSFMDKDFTSNEFYRAVLFDKMNINEGMIIENIVAQVLRANGHKLFFYSRNDNKNRKNHMEIDFLIQRNNKVCPVEVKSSGYRKLSSLDKFKTKFKNRIGQPYVLYQKDLLEKDGVLQLPLYMSFLL